MELIRYESPFAYEKAMALWIDVFGAEEALPETPHVDGSEREENRDIYFLAQENGHLLGTIHSTIPRDFPAICGISGMCTAPDARGKGLGRLLFSKIVEEMDSLGVKAMFLGTENSVAAKLYHSCGFSFLPGSNVMARFSDGDWIDLTRTYFQSAPGTIRILPASPGMRIPLVPLALYRGSFQILDCNTELVNCALFTQPYCMSLHPKYSQVGSVLQARSESGVLGAVCSAMPTESGMRTDFFCCESFMEAVPRMLDRVGECYLHIAETDTRKREMAESIGFFLSGHKDLTIGSWQIPGMIYRR